MSSKAMVRRNRASDRRFNNSLREVLHLRVVRARDAQVADLGERQVARVVVVRVRGRGRARDVATRRLPRWRDGRPRDARRVVVTREITSGMMTMTMTLTMMLPARRFRRRRRRRGGRGRGGGRGRDAPTDGSRLGGEQPPPHRDASDARELARHREVGSDDRDRSAAVACGSRSASTSTSLAVWQSSSRANLRG